MELLKGRFNAFSTLALVPALVCATVYAQNSQDGVPFDPREKLIEAQAKSLCSSTDEYVKTLTFLRTSKEFLVPEKTARLISEKVSKGCDGAAERFEKILLLMKSAGLSDPKSLETALRFSAYTPDVQRNFSEIFSKAFLAEFFDYDYATAIALALELSRDYEGEPATVREDFLYLAKLCKDGKNMELPAKTCAEYAVKVAKLSASFPEGIRPHFQKLYQTLREDRDFGMDIKSALELTYKILRNGPRAPDNFMSAYQFAMKAEGLELGRSQALEFALRMARHSYTGNKLPIIPAVTKVTSASID